LKFLGPLPDSLSVAFETNGKGHLGFIAELPGAFLRGRSEAEALAKLDCEVECYLRWLGIANPKKRYGSTVVQRHTSSLTVEDADCEILLEADRRAVGGKELDNLSALSLFSGRSLLQTCSGAKLKDWVDEARVRKCFHGNNPTTVQEVFQHVKGTQLYYLSRLPLPLPKSEDFMEERTAGLREIKELAAKEGGSLHVYRVDNEDWTVRKVLRRFVWHDRIHGRAVVRMLRKQRRLGLINDYVDPFFFGDYLECISRLESVSVGPDTRPY